MGNGQPDLSVLYLKTQALSEVYTEPQLTYGFQRTKADCHCNTGALVFGINFDGMSLTYNHSLAAGDESTLPACILRGSSRYK